MLPNLSEPLKYKMRVTFGLLPMWKALSGHNLANTHMYYVHTKQRERERTERNSEGMDYRE